MLNEILWIFLGTAAAGFGFAYGAGLAVVIVVTGLEQFRKFREAKRGAKEKLKIRLSPCPDCRGTGFQLVEAFTTFGLGAALLIKFPPVKCSRCAGIGFFSEEQEVKKS